MSSIFEGVEALTFDCYGTIVDWERGILAALSPLLSTAEERPSDLRLLEMFARFESEAESGSFRSYRRVLTEVAERYGDELEVQVPRAAAERFAASVPEWPLFPDSVDALRALKGRFRLAVVSNVDDDLFAGSATRLGVDFDEVVTAEQVRSYKPAAGHFHEVVRRLDLPVRKIVHVAQSLYHDVAPATALGFACVWVDRRSGRPGGGATPPAAATPSLAVPDLAALVRETRVRARPPS
ncbi:MAG: haloacid dehalogenase type II [Longimicrobiales bacterium]|nr:haloacid dehalogenase type II [Longimicrobiales bacterium]